MKGGRGVGKDDNYDEYQRISLRGGLIALGIAGAVTAVAMLVAFVLEL